MATSTDAASTPSTDDPVSGGPGGPVVSGVAEHRVRVGLRDPETGYRLDDEGLWVEPEGRPPRCVSLAQVDRMSIRKAPGATDLARFVCVLDLRDGRRVRIVSTSCPQKRRGKSENRGETYTPLIRDLAVRVAAANPNCQFRAASQPWVYYMAAFAVIFIGGIVIFALAGRAEPMTWNSETFFGLIAPLCFLAFGAGTLGFAFPRSIQPADIPPRFLP